MAIDRSSCTPKDALAKAERHVIRCAMGIVNSNGWSMFKDVNGAERVIYPDAIRRLEGAIAKLQEARKAVKRGR